LQRDLVINFAQTRLGTLRYIFAITDSGRAMGKAFDRACHSLHDIGQPDLVREIIANEIKDYGEKKYT